MTSAVANGSAHLDGDPSISWPISHDHHSQPDPLGRINAGGISRPPVFRSSPPVGDETLTRFEKQYLPGYSKSLSGIAVRAFLLGLVFSISLIAATYLLLFTPSPLWRLPSFLAALSLFHFLEFWTTARYNTRAVQVSSFLLSQNGSAYNIAHTAAMVECLITNFFFPYRSWTPHYLGTPFIFAGIVMIIIGQAVRSIAMAEAGTNFNHIVQQQKADEHQLVTTGVYHYLRHPSYFGFFWWGLGTQLLLGNAVCFLGYAIALWRFFSRRISGEEELLVAFFGSEYEQYRQKTGVWIPFLS